MGSRLLGQDLEWAEQGSIDWGALSYEPKRQVQDMVRELNRTYTATPALYRRDNDPAGFVWLAVHEVAGPLIKSCRLPASDSGDDRSVVHGNPAPMPARSTGLPEVPGRAWEELLNTDDPASAGPASATGRGSWPSRAPGTGSRPRHRADLSAAGHRLAAPGPAALGLNGTWAAGPGADAARSPRSAPANLAAGAPSARVPRSSSDLYEGPRVWRIGRR